MNSTEKAPACIAIVDPFSTGACVAAEAYARGFKVIALWTSEVGEMRYHVPTELAAITNLYVAEIDEIDYPTLETLAVALHRTAANGGCRLAHLICGGETGVKITDHLSEYMGLRGNGTAGGMENRRDKSVQQEAVKASGLRGVREVCGTDWAEEMEEFCAAEGAVIVKPVESAGSDGVKLCHTTAEAHEHLELLMNSQRKVGATGAAVLLQEYLSGTEYVIDCVSRNGVHKVTMVWVYDRRRANGAGFVLYGMYPVATDSEVAQPLIKYTLGCLDALKIMNGATHSEVMMTEDGPCLVEVNSRTHGAAGAWLPLASRLTGGITQVNALLDVYVDDDAFERLPFVPAAPFKTDGAMLTLVSYHEGATVTSTPGYDAIRSLRSYVSLLEGKSVGEKLEKTVDLFGICGMCVLVHGDPNVLAADVATIRQMEEEGAIFEVCSYDERRISITDRLSCCSDASMLSSRKSAVASAA